MHDKPIQIDLPPWPYIKGERVRVRVSERRYLFGHLIAGSKGPTRTVLCDGGQIIQTMEKADVR